MGNEKLLKIMNVIIGIGMMAGSVCLGVLSGGAATPVAFVGTREGFRYIIEAFGTEFFGASSEFLGDGMQGWLASVVDSCQKNKMLTKLGKDLSQNSDIKTKYIDICKKISADLLENNDKKLGNKVDKILGKSNISKRDRKIIEKANAKLIMDVTHEILLYASYDEYLSNASKTYKDLKGEDEKIKDYFLELIKQSVFCYLKFAIHNYGDNTQALYSSAIVFALENYFDKKFKEQFGSKSDQEIADSIKYRIADVSIEHATLSQYKPKFILNACPGCGYDGPMIYVDDKTNTMHCAACGCSYHALEYAEPDYWKTVQKQLVTILQNQDEQASILQELKNGQQDNNKAFTDIIELLKGQNEQFKAGFETIVTQQYLTNVLNGQNKDIKEHADQAANDVKDCFKIYMSQILKQLYKNGNELNQIQAQNEDNKEAVLDAIAQVNAKNAEYNEILCEKMDSLGQTINEIGKYVMKKTEATQQNTEVILKYVQQLCTKEMLDSMRDFLIDSQSTLMSEMGDVRNEGALTRSEIAKIASRIDDVMREWSNEKEKNDQFWEDKTNELKNDIKDVASQISKLQESNDKNYAYMIDLEREGSRKIDTVIHQLAQLLDKADKLDSLYKLFALGTKLKNNRKQLFEKCKSKMIDNRTILTVSNYCDEVEQTAYNEILDNISKNNSDMIESLEDIERKMENQYQELKTGLEKGFDVLHTDNEQIRNDIKALNDRVFLYQNQSDCQICHTPQAMSYICNICGSHGNQNVAQLEVQAGLSDSKRLLVIKPQKVSGDTYEINFSQQVMVDMTQVERILILNDIYDKAVTIRTGCNCVHNPSLGSMFTSLKHFAISKPTYDKCRYEIVDDNFFDGCKNIKLYGMQFVRAIPSKALDTIEKNNIVFVGSGFNSFAKQ